MVGAIHKSSPEGEAPRNLPDYRVYPTRL
jgi:hypothetical protein